VQTEIDQGIVDWIAGVGAAEARHVMRRFGIGRTRAYRRLNQLVADAMLVHHSVLHRQSGLYVATRRGLRWCGLARLGVYRVGAAGQRTERP
jgi:hypothetical protein